MSDNGPQQITTDVCIVGGGPAGMVLGLLLAGRGVKVLVLESHKDFAREYRGEVLMPRFIQMMRQIGLLEYLQTYPHLTLKNFEIFFKDRSLARVSFSDLSPEVPFAWWMPQTVMLNALWAKARNYPAFDISFATAFRDLIWQDGRVVGAVAERDGQKFEVRARVTVGADGRFSVVRQAGKFAFEYEHHDFDLVWFTVKHTLDHENTVRAFFTFRHRYLVLPKYPDSVQCGLIIGKGEFPRWRARGIEAMRRELLDGHPVMHDFARQLKDFNDFSVLQARVSYVKQWAKDGCLLIGDAAHTCSPAGAIGVSVATATAIVAADVLLRALAKNDVSQAALDEVQKKREQEVKDIQKLQATVTNVVLLRFPYLQWLSVAAITLAARTGILPRLQKRIAVMDKPLPIDPGLRF